MQSPPSGPPLFLIPFMHEAVDLASIALLFAAMGWAWAECARRLREADARLGSRPWFGLIVLILFSATSIVALAASRVPLRSGPPTVATHLLVLLPAGGLLLIAALARLGRTSRWKDFLRERERRRTEGRVAAERRTTLAESVRRNLDGPIHALEDTARGARQHWLASEAAAALMTIDAEVDRLKEIQRLAMVWAPDESATERASVEAACAELLARVRAVHRGRPAVRFYGIEGLCLDLPRRHADTMLWGAFEAALAAADEHEPMVEVMFALHDDQLCVDFESNGGPGHGALTGRHDGVEAARLVVALHHGVLLPEVPPYGSKLRIRLPAHVVVPTRAKSALREAVSQAGVWSSS